MLSPDLDRESESSSLDPPPLTEMTNLLSGEKETLPTPNLCPVSVTRQASVPTLHTFTAGLWPDSPDTICWSPPEDQERQVTVFLSPLMMWRCPCEGSNRTMTQPAGKATVPT